jgi:hypothetical protein
MVLPSQDVKNPTSPTVTSKNSLHIPLNAMSLYQKPIPLFSNNSVDSKQPPALFLMDLTPSRPIIAHLDFAAQNSQPIYGQKTSPPN